MSLMKPESNAIVYNQKEIMPYGKIGNGINWSKVFKDKIGLFYPKPINRNTSTNEQGEFDADKFYFSRRGVEEKRGNYLEELERIMLLLNKVQQRGTMEGFFILDCLSKIQKAFEDMHIVGEGGTGIYEQTFYANIKELQQQIRAEESLPENNSLEPIYNDIQTNVDACLKREGNERNKLVQQIKEIQNAGMKTYTKEDGFIDVDAILKDLNSHRERNEEFMLMAFYTAKCSKEDLTRLQKGTIEALNNKVKRLDTFKVFIILERVLPFIHANFKIDWDLPELFRPEYLNKISIYNLDIDGFAAQVKSKGEKYNRSEKIQNKLITQFKEYGQKESGKIGFGQGSEQLRYRNGVTGGVDEKNFKYYLKEPNLGEEKRPIPRILKIELPDQKDDLARALKQ